MIRRFSLYGFLKNQRYFEPFIILAFLEKGLGFFDIGLLMGFREMAAIVLEIPSGAVADIFGRRRSMIVSFLFYILSFVTFALADHLFLLLVAMFFFALGDSFRTGTHKSMIFQWLQLEGRLDERTAVYGYTRSWSKMGSALSSLVAGVLVFLSGNYVAVFWLSIIPYVLNLVNFLGYPAVLEGESRRRAGMGEALRLTGEALHQTATRPRLRALVAESMLLEGTFKVTKDYLQPILKVLALGIALPFLGDALDPGMAAESRSAILIGLVFFVHFLLMGVASRNAHRLVERAGGEDSLTRWAWLANLGAFLLMGWGLMAGQAWLAVSAFIGLGMIQNTFRPAQISRIDRHSESEMGATILSIESQSKSLAGAFLAPVLGWFVEAGGIKAGGVEAGRVMARGVEDPTQIDAFWPVAVLGCLASLVGLFLRRRGS